MIKKPCPRCRGKVFVDIFAQKDFPKCDMCAGKGFIYPEILCVCGRPAMVENENVLTCGREACIKKITVLPCENDVRQELYDRMFGLAY